MTSAVGKLRDVGVAVVGGIGRGVSVVPRWLLQILVIVGGATQLTGAALYYSTIGPLRGENKLRKQLFPIMTNVGVRSLAVVCLISLLTGTVLVLQTGKAMERYGQIQEVPGFVALSMTRALGPLMTAIVMISRVGASFTAVLGAMSINDEILALRAMSINPVGYLVAPRVLGMVIMMPCLAVFAYLLGMSGAAGIAYVVYDIGFALYTEKTFAYLTMADLAGGLLKSVVFGFVIGVISCYYGLRTEGGPTGLGRNIMVSVVSCLVAVVFVDMILTAFLVNRVL